MPEGGGGDFALQMEVHDPESYIDDDDILVPEDTRPLLKRLAVPLSIAAAIPLLIMGRSLRISWS